MGKSVSESDHDRVFERAAELFGLLSAPIRVRIVCELLDGERNVGELTERLGVSQPNLSQHLSTLYRCGLLTRRRAGSLVLYRVTEDRVPMLTQLMAVRRLALARERGAPPLGGPSAP